METFFAQFHFSQHNEFWIKLWIVIESMSAVYVRCKNFYHIYPAPTIPQQNVHNCPATGSTNLMLYIIPTGKKETNIHNQHHPINTYILNKITWKECCVDHLEPEKLIHCHFRVDSRKYHSCNVSKVKWSWSSKDKSVMLLMSPVLIYKNN